VQKRKTEDVLQEEQQTSQPTDVSIPKEQNENKPTLSIAKKPTTSAEKNMQKQRRYYHGARKLQQRPSENLPRSAISTRNDMGELWKSVGNRSHDAMLLF
tara:strand:+ start:240 stop:539 length:300 start_codon:yes stop_codon:yes gene_type:complete